MERYRALAGIHVLVVDDNEDGRELIKHVLVHDDATVTTAQSGVEALETLKFTVPDVLVSDIAMPGETGYWLMQEIRKLPASYGGKLPALAVTAFGAVFSRERALEVGFNDYLSKPLDPWELCRCVARLAGRAP
jgi:CheY-like chemotaxis protein